MIEPAPPAGFLALAEEYQAAATIPRLLVLVSEKSRALRLHSRLSCSRWDRSRNRVTSHTRSSWVGGWEPHAHRWSSGPQRGMSGGHSLRVTKGSTIAHSSIRSSSARSLPSSCSSPGARSVRFRKRRSVTPASGSRARPRRPGQRHLCGGLERRLRGCHRRPGRLHRLAQGFGSFENEFPGVPCTGARKRSTSPVFNTSPGRSRRATAAAERRHHRLQPGDRRALHEEHRSREIQIRKRPSPTRRGPRNQLGTRFP